MLRSALHSGERRKLRRACSRAKPRRHTIRASKKEVQEADDEIRLGHRPTSADLPPPRACAKRRPGSRAIGDQVRQREHAPHTIWRPDRAGVRATSRCGGEQLRVRLRHAELLADRRHDPERPAAGFAGSARRALAAVRRRIPRRNTPRRPKCKWSALGCIGVVRSEHEHVLLFLDVGARMEIVNIGETRFHIVIIHRICGYESFGALRIFMKTRLIKIAEIVRDGETEHLFAALQNSCRYEIFRALRNVLRTRIDTAGTGNYKFGRQLIPTTMRRQRPGAIPGRTRSGSTRRV